MQFSYSRVNTFAQCPYKFKLQYLDEVTTIRDPAADDALIVGSAMHKGIEEGVEAADAGSDKTNDRPEDLFDEDAADHRSQHHRRHSLLRVPSSSLFF